ncbi:MAG: CAP domain-containing protein [Clostridiales bacterium]|nr:CAP domain-containing protein [Clostridiales bacterium]
MRKRLSHFFILILIFVVAFPAVTRAAAVSLTPEEKTLLAAGRAAYASAAKQFGPIGGSLFAEPPQCAALPLRAGVFLPNKSEGAVAYLNAIRIAAGLPPLEYSPALCLEAQHKAVLWAYADRHDIPFGDLPAHGADPAFFGKADATPCTEHRHFGDIRASLLHALTETFEPKDRPACADRHRLLDPRYRFIGLGQSQEGGPAGQIQAVHKLSGPRVGDADLIAWPPRGVMAAETLPPDGALRWSIQFLAGYQVTAGTKIEVVCLNTGQVWSFGETQEGGDVAYAILPDLNMVSFSRRDMALVSGFIYEIWLFGLENTVTGEQADYRYRTTVQYLSGLRGDANEDGVVDAADAAAVLRHLVELTALTETGKSNALVTGNASLSSADAAKILRWLVQLEKEL